MDRESSQEPLGHAPTNEILAQINESFDQSKSDQIIRLIGDQDNLSKRFKQFALDNECDSNGCDQCNSSSDNGRVGEDESKLALRPSLQKHEGCRSKTSIGFYDCEYDEINSPPPEMAETVTDSNTRKNRPKSSYVRRRQHFQTPDSNYEGQMNSDYENPSSHGSRRLRPRSRAGRSADQGHRKLCIQETDVDIFDTEFSQRNANTGGTQFHDSRQRKLAKTCVQETNIDLELDLGDLGDDDRPRHKKLVPRETDLDLYIAQHRTQANVDSYQNIARQGKIIRQERNTHSTNSRPPPRGDNAQVRHGCRKQGHQNYLPTTTAPRESPNLENKQKERASHHIMTTPALLIRRQKTNVRKLSGAAENTSDRNHYAEIIKPHQESRKGTKGKDDRRAGNSHIHRAKTTMQPTESRRPNSESVFIVRQRAEKKLITVNASTRPKSEKILLNTRKAVLSINDSPYQSAQSSPAKIQQSVLSSPTAQQQTRKDCSEFNGAHVRIMSAKRKIPPQELQLPRQPNVNRDRSQAMALVKLPPLDATMSKLAERLVVARETCV